MEVTDPGLLHGRLLRQLREGLGFGELAARASELEELIGEKTSDIVWRPADCRIQQLFFELADVVTEVL